MRPDEMRIEPALIYPIDETADSPADCCGPASGIPLFNLEVLRSLLAVDSGNVIDEAIQLSEELGSRIPRRICRPGTRSSCGCSAAVRSGIGRRTSTRTRSRRAFRSTN